MGSNNNFLTHSNFLLRKTSNLNANRLTGLTNSLTGLTSDASKTNLNLTEFNLNRRSSSPLFWMLSSASSPPSPNLGTTARTTASRTSLKSARTTPTATKSVQNKIWNKNCNANNIMMQKKSSTKERKISDLSKKSLKSPSFDVWKWNHEELIGLFEEMYEDLDIVEGLKINKNTLHTFLRAVEMNYQDNPFHNFRHCFCVTQMMFVLIKNCHLDHILDKLDLAVLITASICHDLDHPGLNNSYQINAKTELADRYKGMSPLENHHKDKALALLAQPETNIFSSCSIEEYNRIQKEISNLILATDMSLHNEFLLDFQSKIESGFDFDNSDHISSLKSILIKACDVSNECRPINVSEAWVERLLEEYFTQSDLEKTEGLPFAPFMDRQTVTKPKAQIGFIKFVLIPLFEALSKILPEVETITLSNLRKSLDYYEKIKEKDENST